MPVQNILDLTREGLLIAFWISLPAVAVSAVTGLVVAMLQAVTQIQDQSLGQALRLLAVMLTVIIFAGVLSHEILRFGERAFQTFASIR